nr:glycosyltransferase family 4 protein [uncultured Sphingomonas sp.]
MTVHVAFVLAGLHAGGAERVIEIVSRAAIERGWQVTVVAFDSPASPPFNSFHPDVRLERLDLPPHSGGVAKWWAVARRLAALRRLLHARQFTVLVSFLTKINVLSLISASGTGIPTIVAERNNPQRQAMSPAWNFALRVLYARAAQIVLQTERSRACLPAGQRARAVVLPNPMDRSRGPQPVAPDLPVLVAVGRLTAQKGFDLLLDAFSAIAGAVPAWQLVIWGEGPDRQQLERQVERLGLAGRVRLPGLSEVPGSWVSTGSCFVLPSRYEGFPNVLLEAMRARMAVVAFDCDYGPSELIEHGRNGLLVANGDVHALGQALLQVMQDPSFRAHLAAQASDQAWVKRATPESWIDLIDGHVAPRCTNLWQ